MGTSIAMGKGGNNAADAKVKVAAPKGADGPKVLFINDIAYDVTNFVDKHPGGKVIDYYLKGEDATDCFDAFHYRSKKAQNWLKTLPTIDNVTVPKAPKIATDFRALKKEWEAKGYFEPNPLVAVYKWLEIFGMLAVALSVAPQNWFVGGIIVGFAWTRTGWIQHDSGHVAFTGTPKVDHYIQNFFEGFIKGGSGAWWRNRHNKHHAKPNVHKFDSDLNTLPFLAWDDKLAATCPKSLIRIQHYTYFPLLSLYVFVFAVTTKLFMYRKQLSLEIFCCAAHFAAWLPFLHVALGMPWSEVCGFYCMGYAFQGLYLGYVFSLNHFPMPVLHEKEDEKMDWVTLQGLTTRNMEPHWFVTWFSGDLNYQIEHHLCPQMPPYRYHLIFNDVQKLFAKHNLEYDMKPIGEATVLSMNMLRDVAHRRELVKHAFHQD